ncbi:DUF2235 domain-containing protein [Pantoea sp. BRR-3P]|uniref:T6SS phospholipase effector Tle1-like catalytic domain-containing protein n=1 Tax=Pantoea sp. BRR-3P TaxID=3141541 RepID=UPI0031F4B2C9
MSKVIERDLVWYPPSFPPQGRLPDSAALVGLNCKKQDSEELEYRQALCVAAGQRVEPPCCKTLHISIFFDGTGNNLNNDLYLSNPKHPTNIARLFRATIGSGYAGGVGRDNGELFDINETGADKYFKFYLPGVGTPFPEINDLDYSIIGLALAHMGEERINWALLRIIDVLNYVLKEKWMSNAEVRKAVKNMGTTWARLGYGGSHNRYEEFTRQLSSLKSLLKPALDQPEPGKPKLLGIKLYVYGFSRGAATARAFVRWLCELLPPPEVENTKPEQCLTIDELKIPISVEFLGLLDTVASVGVAHIAPLAEGHMAWADDTMELPDEVTYGGLIKRCAHLVSSHEQRLCFPLDSIRRCNGKYPENSIEVVYPGMHSDVGGGYPPGDQGKANGPNDSLLLSQIILNDIYCEAFNAGAPLKVPEDSLSNQHANDNWRKLPLEVMGEFLIHRNLIKRFNAWREFTLNQSTPKEFSSQEAADYKPVRATASLEAVIEDQMAWITGWRIGRYAHETLINARFYEEATNSDNDPKQYQISKKNREDKQGEIESKRVAEKCKYSKEELKDIVMPAGVKDFDPDIAKRQLWEAAREFREDYQGKFRSQKGVVQVVIDNLVGRTIFRINTDDEVAEFKKMRTEGDVMYKLLFPFSDESRNATNPSGLVRSLFDNQVHDSRAWFLYSALGTREPWGGYFRYRMIYFGNKSNKSLSPLVIAGDVVGAVSPVAGVIISLKQKQDFKKVFGLAATAGLEAFDIEMRDVQTNELIPMLPDAAQQQQFTDEPGAVVANYKAVADEHNLMMAKNSILSDWSNKEKTLSA